MNFQSETAEPSWQAIVDAVETLRCQSESKMPAKEFHDSAVDLLVQCTAATSGRFWTREQQTGASPTVQTWLTRASENDLPQCQIDDQRTWWYGVRGDDEGIGVLELRTPANTTMQHRQGTQQLLPVVGELIANHYRANQLRELKHRELFRGDFDRFTHTIHESLDVDRVAYAIANLGRPICDADRLSVLIARRRSFRVIAVSGVETIDRRSESVRSIERLARQRAPLDEPCWIEADSDNETASTKIPFENLASSTGLLPLLSTAGKPGRKPRVIGLIALEWFETPPTQLETVKTRARWLAGHSSRAIENAVRSQSLPLSGLGRFLDRYFVRGHGFSWVTLAAIVACCAALLLTRVQADFTVEARGTLQPLRRQIVYAPRNATVVSFPMLENRVSVDQRIPVTAGDVVVRLESADLQYELTTLLGEQATVTRQLETNSVVRGQLGQTGIGNSGANRERLNELIAQSSELKVRSESLAKRIELIEQEMRGLDVAATIDGQVATWDIQEKLRGRPVVQGDRLLEIVDTGGEWELRLAVPDQQIGYVNQASQETDVPLSITFIEKSNPTVRHESIVKEIGISTEVLPEYGASVRVVGDVGAALTRDAMRPGTSVIAQIHCGRRSLGFIWLHELIEAVRMRLLF